ncbi:MAG: serine/threonine protein kinase [Gammaproteobacteria bacterium]|nr:serine/threonine protein kinase [Gammaproteobacteria bacterium]MDX2486873.1 serine/threonine protein kinase [Gammaproteobacteria bacterium]
MSVDTDSTTTEAFTQLTPDHMLDAIESLGLRCDGRFLALNSYENRVYQVGIEDQSPLVAKFYRPARWSNEAITEEHEFTLALAALEIPVIAPVIDKNGVSLHQHGPYRFALYPCRGGRAPELDNPEHLEQLGRFIARIHAEGATKKFNYRPDLDIESFAIKPREYLLSHDFIPVHLINAYESLTTDLIKQIGQCFDRAGDVANIRLHGDCHPGNILWTDDGPHIVDFDDARTGPAMQDLWMFLSGDRAYMTARLADLLEGYTQFYDFNPVELHLIEALRTMRLIHYSAWLARRWEDPAFPLAFPWFNSMNYWEDQILTLREQAALMNEPALVWD